MWIEEHLRPLIAISLIAAALLFSAVVLTDDASASSQDRSGMKVSIIGDSLSDDKAYEEVFPDSGMTVDDFWWAKLIKDWGAEKLVNHAVSGTCCGYDIRYGKPRANVEITHTLHEGDAMPDIVLILIGTNDYLNIRNFEMGNASKGDIEGYLETDKNPDGTWRDSYDNLMQAYTLMLKRIIDYYGNDRPLEIICLLPFAEPSQMYSEHLGGIYWRDTLNAQLSGICDYFNDEYKGGSDVKCIDLSKCGMPARYSREAASYYVDAGGRYEKFSPSLHPNAAGMQLMFDYIKTKLDDTEKKVKTVPIPEGSGYLYGLIADDSDPLGLRVVESHIENGTATPLSPAGPVPADGPDASITSTGNPDYDVNSFWDFDPATGLGPFNSFYAAINLEDGSNGDDRLEKRLSSKAGTVAYVLNPYDLKETVAGTSFTPSLYNVMLVIPAVYWKEVDGTLYMSDSPEYSCGDISVSGMKAYAHTLKDSAGKESVHPYIALGVYESSVLGSGVDAVLVSQSGKVPEVSCSLSTFSEQAGNNRSYGQGAYQIWNLYQWTLYKMMTYSVMGSMNSSQMVGLGFNDDQFEIPAQLEAGTTDPASPYFGTLRNPPNSIAIRTTGTKLFLENTWGNVGDMIGDAYVKGTKLYAGNTLGGGAIGSQDPVAEVTGITGKGWIDSTLSSGGIWDLPVSDTDDNSTDLRCHGDSVVWSDGVPVVGGCYDAAHAKNGAASLSFMGPNTGSDKVGARLAYVMDDLLAEDGNDLPVWTIVTVILTVLVVVLTVNYLRKR